MIALLFCSIFAFIKCEWKLVWADEFDVDADHADPTKWEYEREDMHKNNEQQTYTNRTVNLYVKGGNLYIHGQKEDRGGYPYTSASIFTRHVKSWTYGRFECRCKLPQGQGVWPAFWMLGDTIEGQGWPKCGEIDIMEYVGNHPDDTYGTVHYANANGQHEQQGGQTHLPDPAGWHTHAIEWDENHMVWFLDGKQYQEVDIRGIDSFHKPQHLILNLAIGGDWPGPTNANIWPQDFVIDYVRVYQQA